MKRVVIMGSLAGMLFFGGLIAVLFIVHGQTNPLIQSDSPAKTYSVDVIPNKLQEAIPIPDQDITFTVRRKGSQTVSGALTTLDWSSRGFLSQYPDHTWTRENILTFANRSSGSRTLPDSLIISNHSNKDIDYLVVSALDIFLVLDIRSKATIELMVPRYKWQSWITAQGRFLDGAPILERGVNFLHRDEAKGSLLYCIDIQENVLEVSSGNVEGWTFDTPRVPISPNCHK